MSFNRDTIYEILNTAVGLGREGQRKLCDSGAGDGLQGGHRVRLHIIQGEGIHAGVQFIASHFPRRLQKFVLGGLLLKRYGIPHRLRVVDLGGLGKDFLGERRLLDTAVASGGGAGSVREAPALSVQVVDMKSMFG